MLSDPEAHRLRDHLVAGEFLYGNVTQRLGPSAVAALARNTSVAAERSLDRADDAQALLIRAWLLQQAVRVDALSAVLGDLDPLLGAGLLLAHGDLVRAGVEIRPYATDDGFDGWVVADLTPGMDGRRSVPPPDFVLGVSPASTTLAQLTVRTPVGSALDLGTGCGVQGLHLSSHAQQVVATDLNPRALELANLTFRLNQVAADLRAGSLYEPVQNETFDLIVSNPPYVMSPPAPARLVYREGSFQSDEMVRRVVAGGAARLNPGGVLQVLGNWAVTAGEPWQERLHRWIAPTGCDALVLQRELLDPYEYVEVWLADAGLTGSRRYREHYLRWMEYFDSLGIIGVGMGWLSLYRRDRDDPEITIEDWPHAVYQPVGPAFGRYPDVVALSRLPEEALLARVWHLVDTVVQETAGEPGAADPHHLVLRDQSGFGRAIEADTALAAVLGACDGDVPLGALIDAVARLLDLDAEAATADLVPRLREVIAAGLLA